MRRFFNYLFFSIVSFAIIFTAYFLFVTTLKEPQIKDLTPLLWQIEEPETGLTKVKNNWFRRSESGIYELYVEGAPFERGIANGLLTKKLILKQDKFFAEQIHNIAPSAFYLQFLKYVVKWFDKDLPMHINKEQLEEIYGVSHSFSDDFNFIAPKYTRSLNYHLVYDISRTLEGRNFRIGSTSFSAWDNKTKNGEIIVGRNFDFYLGDKFSEDKIVNFVSPNNGYKLMFVTWAGFIGAVSGINETGLTVTINAVKSEFPTKATTPISLLAKEILQYASTIDEAYLIAKKRQIFVSESILICSAKDQKSAIIEKSPTKIGLHTVKNNYIICSNNFQSEIFKNDSLTVENIRTSSSQYRHQIMDELLHKNPVVTNIETVSILRNRFGKNNEIIGNGNKKALNQLIAHHSVIFNPEQQLMWVSVSPYQIGKFACYDLNKIFNNYSTLSENIEIKTDVLEIKEDVFLHSKEYEKYQEFQLLQKEILSDNYILMPIIKNTFIKSNPNYYLTYYTLGDYHFKNSNYDSALTYYNSALTRELPEKDERDYLTSQIEICISKQTKK